MREILATFLHSMMYTVDNYVTISELLHVLRGITVTVSKRRNKARLANVKTKKRQLIKDLGFEHLIDSADGVWGLLLAKRLCETIRKVREADNPAL